ncbi:hypothetical protein LB504_011457 [Fusarium proliferatum]|nr:hypothetical protein LB504_011457 [Fusarium proliferatum]
MHYNYFLLAFVATALALPTAKPAGTGKRVPASYEGKGANFGYGPWVPKEYEKRKGDGSWQPGKHEDKWTPTKYPGRKSKTRRDKVDVVDDSREPKKYEGKGTNFEDAKLMSEKHGRRSDDGSWRPGKYEGDCTGYDDGKWNPEKQD